jgi:hypothetical protein
MTTASNLSQRLWQRCVAEGGPQVLCDAKGCGDSLAPVSEATWRPGRSSPAGPSPTESEPTLAPAAYPRESPLYYASANSRVEHAVVRPTHSTNYS